jgi:holo-[acyl-carrier protein] synthase
MRLIGIGIDLVDLESFKIMYGVETDLARIFSDEEIAYSGNSDSRFVHLAARFAAKEAALKALGCGLQDGISLTDITVLKLASGAPQLELMRGALHEANRLGVDGWMISLTQIEVAAAAVAVAFSTGPK